MARRTEAGEGEELRASKQKTSEKMSHGGAGAKAALREG